MKKILFTFITLLLFSGFAFAGPFNDEITKNELDILNSGEVLIKNIKYDKNMCLKKSFNDLSDKLINEMEELNPKYLAEIIQIKPYKGNEDLPDKLVEILNNVPDYAGIPYYSERHETYYDLYSSATIKETKQLENQTQILADLIMAPFGEVNEKINIFETPDTVLYTSVNLNKLRYLDKFDCVKPENMKMCILLLRDEDNWILYGIGGVNAPRIPFFTGRIETSFMNRIKTFCNFIFKKF